MHHRSHSQRIASSTSATLRKDAAKFVEYVMTKPVLYTGQSATFNGLIRVSKAEVRLGAPDGGARSCRVSGKVLGKLEDMLFCAL